MWHLWIFSPHHHFHEMRSNFAIHLETIEAKLNVLINTHTRTHIWLMGHRSIINVSVDTFATHSTPTSKHTQTHCICAFGFELSLVARIALKFGAHKIYVPDVDEFGIEHAVCINNIDIGLLYFTKYIYIYVCGSPHGANTYTHMYARMC